MRKIRRGTILTAATVVAGVALLASAPPAAAQETESHRIQGPRAAVYNLAGRAEVVPGGGSDIVVRVSRRGADADRLAVALDEIDGRPALRVIYPDDRIIYPEMGRGSATTRGVRSDGTFGGGGGDRITIRGSGDGLEAWADLRIEVPAGRTLEVFVAVGEGTAMGLDADLGLDMGSGGVTVRDHRGRLRVDTGSGGITVSDVEGDVVLDTGSGSVRADRLRGDRLEIDTGSGRVEASGLVAESVRVDTGSGSIDARGVDSPEVLLDTGSGSVDVELLRDVDRLEVDTGSGSVTIRAPDDLGARIEVETGSGGIDVDFPVELRTMRRDRIRGTVGDGDGVIRIDTGSGGVRLIRR